MTRILSVEHSPIQISLTFDNDTSVSFAPIWIRESCVCALCRAPGTSFRLSGLRDLDSFIGATTVGTSRDGSTLSCTWPDGHQTELASEWLACQRTTDSLAKRSSSRPNDDAQPALGTDTESKTNTESETETETDSRHHQDTTGPLTSPPVEASQVSRSSSGQQPWQGAFEPERSHYQDLKTEDGHRKWLAGLWRDGVAIVTDMPASRAELTSFANRIGAVQPSNYGPDWEIEASANPTTRVYSQDGLAVHTDIPYRPIPPGVQFNLSEIADATGGKATVADGIAVANELRRVDPEAFRLLATIDFELTWLDAEHDLKHRAPTITVDDAGDYEMFRYAPGLVAPICADPATTQAAHRAYQRFTELAAESRFQIAIQLRPGDLLAMNNHRVLHGRQAFDLRTGRRRLIGCYLDLDDLKRIVQQPETANQG